MYPHFKRLLYGIKTQIYRIIGLFAYMKVINVQNDRLCLQCTYQTVHKRNGKRFELFQYRHCSRHVQFPVAVLPMF